MVKIIINNRKYKIHPIYNLYAASRRGDIINIIRRKPSFGTKQRNGYMKITVRGHGQKGDKSMYVHRFVWESWMGIIPNGLHVDHKNEIIEDNRLENLQLLTPSQNIKKSVKNRDYSFIKDTHKNKRSVKAINKETKEVSYYFSMYACEKHLNVSVGLIAKICEKRECYKFGKSKNDGNWYKFEYIKDDLPVNYIKCENKRPRTKTDEQIKERRKNYDTKDWKCPKCEKVLRNYSRFYHRKHCNSK